MNVFLVCLCSLSHLYVTTLCSRQQWNTRSFLCTVFFFPLGNHRGERFLLISLFLVFLGQ